MSTASDQARNQRDEAKRLLAEAITHGVTYNIDRIVDCIVGAAMLEIVDAMKLAKEG